MRTIVCRALLVSIAVALITGCIALVDIEGVHNDDGSDTTGVLIVFPNR